MAKREVSIAESRQQLPRLIGRLRSGQPIVITKRGTPVAALVSIEDLRRLSGAAPALGSFLEKFYTEWEDDEDSALDDEFFRELREESSGREPTAWE